MLDLSKLTYDINAMAGEYKQQITKYQRQINKAMESLEGYDKDAAPWLDKINSSSRHFFVAFPQGKMANVYRLPDVKPLYTVIAVDGSQIDVDTHEIALCYVLNAGRVVIHYGLDKSPILNSLPKLYFRDDDLYRQQDSGDIELIQGDKLAELRSQMEAEELFKLVRDNYIEDRPILAFTDGRLVSWEKKASAKKDLNGFTAPLFKDLFKFGEGKKILTAGYVSGSRMSLVANTLRASDCQQPIMDCNICKYRMEKDAPCHEIEGLRDITLFKHILSEGERSEVFYAGINMLPRSEWPKYRIGFFYIHGGDEIARVEAPDYILEDNNLLDMLHSMVYDQIQKGMGYPISLQEAHHLAVIKGEEREAFFHLVGRNFSRAGVPIKVTDKKLYKGARIF